MRLLRSWVAEHIILGMDGAKASPQDTGLTDVAVMVAQYYLDLTSELTNWYTALQRLNQLPERMPPLPWNIIQILRGECSIFSEQLPPDEVPLKMIETGVLYLMPDDTVNEFEAVVRAYGAQHYPADANPLQFRYFWPEARAEHGNTASKMHWVWMTRTVIPESRNKPVAEQEALIASLNAKSFVEYEFPTLPDASKVLFLHKVATGESLYEEGNEQNGNIWTYTRVQEATEGYLLTVGGSAPDGLRVDIDYFDNDNLGVGALRKF
jgi:hypothetical protein